MPRFDHERAGPAGYIWQRRAMPHYWNDPLRPQCIGDHVLHRDLVRQRHHTHIAILQLSPLDQFVECCWRIEIDPFPVPDQITYSDAQPCKRPGIAIAQNLFTAN